MSRQLWFLGEVLGEAAVARSRVLKNSSVTRTVKVIFLNLHFVT